MQVLNHCTPPHPEKDRDLDKLLKDDEETKRRQIAWAYKEMPTEKEHAMSTTISAFPGGDAISWAKWKLQMFRTLYSSYYGFNAFV